jgi:hypothetical protein
VRTTHLVSGILMAVLSLFCLLWLIPNHTHPPQSHLDLAPSFLPNIAMGMCLFTALVLTLQAWRMPKNATAELHDEFGEEATGGDRQVLLNVVIWGVTSGIAAYLMGTVGFEISMTLMLAVGLYGLGVRNWTLLIALSLVIPSALSIATWYVLGIQVPGFIEEFAIKVDAILASINGPSE